MSRQIVFDLSVRGLDVALIDTEDLIKAQRRLGIALKAVPEEGSAEYDELDRRIREATSGTVTLESATDRLTTQYGELRDSVRGFNDTLRNGAAEAGSLRDLEVQLRRLQTEFGNLGPANRAAFGDALQRRIRETKDEIDELRVASGRTSNAIRSGFSGLQNTFRDLRTQILSVFALDALVDASRTAFNFVLEAGQNFEFTFSTLRGVLTATEEQFESLRESALQLGSTTAFSASQAAAAQVALARAGLTANEILTASSPVLQLAAATNLELAEAASIATNALGAYELGAESLTNVNNTFLNTVNQSNQNINDLSESFKVVAPFANSVGIELEILNGSLAILANAGLRGSVAGTALRGSLIRLLSPSGAAADALSRLGVETLDSQGNLRDFTTIIGELSASGATASDLIDIFGKNVNAIQVLLNAGSEELERFALGLSDVNEAAVSFDSEAFTESLTTAINQARAEIDLDPIEVNPFEAVELDAAPIFRDQVVALNEAISESQDIFDQFAADTFDLTAAGTILGESLGVTVTEAIGTLGETLQGLQDPSSEATAALQSLGVSLVDDFGQSLSFDDLFQNLIESFDGSSESIAAFQTLFGDAFSGISEELASGTLSFEEFRAAIEENTTAFRTAEEQQDNLRGDLTQLSSITEGLALNAFDRLNDSLRATVQSISGVVGSVSAFIQAGGGLDQFLARNATLIQILGVAFASLSASLLAARLNYVILNAAQALNVVTTERSILAIGREVVLRQASNAAKRLAILLLGTETAATSALAVVNGVLAGQIGLVTAAQQLLNIVLTANPIGLIAVAVGVLVGGFIALYNNSQVLRAAVDGLFSVFSALADVFTDTILPVLIQIGDFIGRAFVQQLEAYKRAFDLLFVQPIQFVLDIYISTFRTLRSGFQSLVDFVSDLIPEGFANAFRRGRDIIFQFISDVNSAYLNFIKDTFNIDLSGVFDSIVQIGTRIRAFFGDVGDSVVQDFEKGFTSRFRNELKDSIFDEIDALGDDFNRADLTKLSEEFNKSIESALAAGNITEAQADELLATLGEELAEASRELDTTEFVNGITESIERADITLPGLRERYNAEIQEALRTGVITDEQAQELFNLVQQRFAAAIPDIDDTTTTGVDEAAERRLERFRDAVAREREFRAEFDQETFELLAEQRRQQLESDLAQIEGQEEEKNLLRQRLERELQEERTDLLETLAQRERRELADIRAAQLRELQDNLREQGEALIDSTTLIQDENNDFIESFSQRERQLSDSLSREELTFEQYVSAVRGLQNQLSQDLAASREFQLAQIEAIGVEQLESLFESGLGDGAEIGRQADLFQQRTDRILSLLESEREQIRVNILAQQQLLEEQRDEGLITEDEYYRRRLLLSTIFSEQEKEIQEQISAFREENIKQQTEFLNQSLQIDLSSLTDEFNNGLIVEEELAARRIALEENTQQEILALRLEGIRAQIRANQDNFTELSRLKGLERDLIIESSKLEGDAIKELNKIYKDAVELLNESVTDSLDSLVGSIGELFGALTEASKERVEALQEEQTQLENRTEAAIENAEADRDAEIERVERLGLSDELQEELSQRAEDRASNEIAAAEQRQERESAIIQAQIAEEEEKQERIAAAEQAVENIRAIIEAAEEFRSAQKRIRDALDAASTARKAASNVAATLQETAVNSAEAITEGAKIPFPANIAAILSIIAALAGGFFAVRGLVRNVRTAAQFEEGGLIREGDRASRGGLLRGRRHSQGGIMIEAEDEEFVINRWGYRLFPNEVRWINNQGRRRMRGLPTEKTIPWQLPRVPEIRYHNAITSTPRVSRALYQEGGQPSAVIVDNESVVQELRGLRQSLQEQEVVVSINEINKVNARKARVRNRAKE